MDKLNQQAPVLQAPEKSHGSKIMLFILGAVMVILIGLGGYMLGANKAQAPVANNTLVQPSISPVDKTANWKTYTDTDAKISIQHPHEWKITEEKQNADYKVIMLEGKEGQVGIGWGVVVFGECQQGYETLKLYRGTVWACHNISNDDTEKWSSLSIGTINNINYSGFATANSPYAFNREVILKILSTLKFTSSEEQIITASVSKDLASADTPGFQIEVKKLLGNYAYGIAGVPPQGFVWYAVKQNNQWKKIWDGQNSPSCAIMNNYNVPKEIYKDCSDNY